MFPSQRRTKRKLIHPESNRKPHNWCPNKKLSLHVPGEKTLPIFQNLWCPFKPIFPATKCPSIACLVGIPPDLSHSVPVVTHRGLYNNSPRYDSRKCEVLTINFCLDRKGRKKFRRHHSNTYSMPMAPARRSAFLTSLIYSQHLPSKKWETLNTG